MINLIIYKILRTPIFYVTNSSERNQKKNVFFNDDPRSPSNEYNRTPINAKESKFINKVDSNDSFEMTADLSTASDSSFLLQQVPDDSATTTSDEKSTNSPDRYALSTKSLANFSSNLPRHILQRKQIQNINKKKFQNLDKENVE